MDMAQQYVGEYLSKEWLMKNVLYFDDDEIKQIQDQIQGEAPEEEEAPEPDQQEPEQDQEEDQGQTHTVKLKIDK